MGNLADKMLPSLFTTSPNQHPVYISYGKSCPLTDSIGYTQSQTPASLCVHSHNIYTMSVPMTRTYLRRKLPVSHNPPQCDA